MFIVIDERESVTSQYVAGFGEEGVSARALPTDGFEIWLNGVPAKDLDSVQGFVLGDFTERPGYTAAIRTLSRAPIIALNETRSLEQTLALFTAGIDDVVRKPAGIVRPRDISRKNTIDYDKIAEARISYGGRGRITDVQNPTVGQQIFETVSPF